VEDGIITAEMKEFGAIITTEIKDFFGSGNSQFTNSKYKNKK